MKRTVRPQGVRLGLGVGLVLGFGVIAAPSSAMSLPAPEPTPAPIPAPVPDPASAPPKTSVPIPSPGPARTLLLPRGDSQRIRVSWPSGHRIVAPASTVRVRISQPRRGERKLTVSLLRLSAKGRILRSVQRTGVTRGTVSVAIPKADGRRYSLRLLRGGKLLRQLTIRTPAVPAAAPVPAPVAPGTNGVGTGWACAAGRVDGLIELSAPSVVAGDPLAFAVLNTGEACFERVGVLKLERWEPESSTWVVARGLSLAQTAVYYTVPAGQRDGSAVGVPADGDPGTHRVTVGLRKPNDPGSPSPAPDVVLIQATFEVTAPPAP